MSKKAKKIVAEPTKMTKRQLSKHQRETRMTRITIIAGAAVFAIAALVLILGFYSQVLAKPGEPIAKVDGKEISLGDYAKVVGYVDFSLDIQRLQLQDLISQSGSGESEQDFTRQFAQQRLQQLEFSKRLLTGQVLDDMIADQLVRREAARRNIAVSEKEIDEEIVKQFSPPPTPAASSPITGTEQSPVTGAEQSSPSVAGQAAGAAVTGTKTIAEATEDLRKVLAQADFLSVQEYRRLIAEGSIYREKLNDALANEVKTTGEQVHARHILVETEEQAKDIIRMLREEGQDFGAVARETSQDSASKEKDGDLGWFPRGVMTKPFEEAAFQLQPGELSEPVSSEFGFHIIRVDERAEDKTLSEETLSQLRQGALAKWLSEQKLPEANRVQRFDTPERLKWANDYVSNKRKEASKRAKAVSK